MSDDGLPPPPPLATSPGPSTNPGVGAAVPNGTVPPPPPPGLTAPPGYVAFQNAPAPSGRLQRVGGLAKWAMIATAMSGIAGAISTALVVPVLDTATGVVDGTVTEDEFNDAYLPSQLLSTFATVIGIAAGVFTILWMYRVAANLRVYSRKTTFAPVFAVVGWLLPPFLFVLPFLVLRELWKASDSDVPIGDEGWRQRPVTPLLPAWFVAYGIIPAGLQAVILSATIRALLDEGASAANSTSFTARVLDASGVYTVAAGVATAVAAVMWIVFVKQLTSRHVRLTGET